MDTEKDGPVHRLVRWLKDKIEDRRGRDSEHDPWWVTLMLDVGRPLVAVLILTMCAPGEHYLAVQAGWNERLAWGMPGALTAYAGIACVVATKRPKGSDGRRTAIWGAVMSVAAAMAAQPIAHLYGRTGLTWQEISLIIAMGVIPGAVFGHLLHLGATAPKPDSADTSSAKKVDKRRTWRKDKPVPKSPADNTTTVSAVGLSTADVSESPGRASDNPSVRSLQNGSLSADVRTFLTDNPGASDTELSEAMADKWPDKPWNSIYKARVRHEDKTRKEA